MVDRLEVAARAHRDATAEESEARRLATEAKARLADARKKVDITRGPLAEAIVEAARSGIRQADIARISGYNRESVRRICRAAGVEPA